MTYQQQLRELAMHIYDLGMIDGDEAGEPYFNQAGVDQAITSIVALGLELIGGDEFEDSSEDIGANDLREKLRSKLQEQEASSE